MNALPVSTVGTTSAALVSVAARANEYMKNSKAPSTLKAYKTDWADFTAWCSRMGVEALPAAPEIVALYISDQAASGKRPATLERRLASISKAHKAARVPSPTADEAVRETLRGIRNTTGTAQRKKSALRAKDLRAMVAGMGEDLPGVRDKAILLVGYAGAFRRSELVVLNVEDIEFSDAGMAIRIRKSKTNQEGGFEEKPIGYGMHESTCPVRALKAWIAAAGIVSGPVFRAVNRHGQMQSDRLSDKGVALIVKRHCEALGLDAAAFAGHSLRSGFITDQYAAGTPEVAIQRVSGHKNSNVMRGYYREASKHSFNFVAAAGL